MTYRNEILTTLMITGALLGLSLSACQSPMKKEYAQQPETKANPSLRVIHNEELRKIMRELNRLSNQLKFQRLPQEMDFREERERQMIKVERIAETMAATSILIPEAISEFKLNEDQKKVFSELADTLNSQARELYQRAKNKSFPDAKETLSSINKTCDSCHKAFRGLSDPGAISP